MCPVNVNRTMSVGQMQDQGFITASLAFGNTVNIKCTACGLGSSGRWRKEHKDICGVDRPPVETTDNLTSDGMYNTLPNEIYFDIPGGESFLCESQMQLDMLQSYVDTGPSENMTL